MSPLEWAAWSVALVLGLAAMILAPIFKLLCPIECEDDQ